MGNIENRIRWKALTLYFVVGVVVALASFLFYMLKNEIGQERQRMLREQELTQSYQQLGNVLNHARVAANSYLSTQNRKQLNSFDKDILILDSMVRCHSNTLGNTEKKKWQQTLKLLNKQSQNLKKLNQYFFVSNPIDSLNQRLSAYKPAYREPAKQLSLRRDTTVRTHKQKKFLKRLKDLFDPKPDSTLLITKEEVIVLNSPDSFPIFDEVKALANDAGSLYVERVRTMNAEVTRLLDIDRQISYQVSELMNYFYDNAFQQKIRSISFTQASIDRNYVYFLLVASFCVFLILLLVLMIINDLKLSKRTRNQIQGLMESRHDLLLSVSHDIKTPLQSIYGYLELESQCMYKESIQYSVSYILALVENLLEFSALEQGQIFITQQRVDIKALSKEMGRMFAPLASEKKLNLRCSSDSVRILTDAVKLRQIIVNLLSNAIKYTTDGEVNISLNYSQAMLTILVSDSGVGIAPEKQQLLFLPFSRVKENNNLAAGSGLGLYVVKGLVETLKGNIQVDSKPNKGTLITVTLPVEVCHAKEVVGKKRISVYEDDAVLSTVIQNMLQKLGHQIVTEQPDVILTDLEMGNFSGFDVLVEAEKIPVVVMSGRSDFTYEMAINHGFVDFLPKPFGMEDLRMIFGDERPDFKEFIEDEDAELRQLFRDETRVFFEVLAEALHDNDYQKARQLCHRLKPMFLLLGYRTDELTRLDIRREFAYAGWKLDVATILKTKV